VWCVGVGVSVWGRGVCRCSPESSSLALALAFSLGFGCPPDFVCLYSDLVAKLCPVCVFCCAPVCVFRRAYLFCLLYPGTNLTRSLSHYHRLALENIQHPFLEREREREHERDRIEPHFDPPWPASCLEVFSCQPTANKPTVKRNPGRQSRNERIRAVCVCEKETQGGRQGGAGCAPAASSQGEIRMSRPDLVRLGALP
jgi:hypothetical protein